jgi:hypothetical protein
MRRRTFPRGDNTEIGFTCGPPTRVVFLRRPLAFGPSFMRFRHVIACSTFSCLSIWPSFSTNLKMYRGAFRRLSGLTGALRRIQAVGPRHSRLPKTR